MEINYNIDQLVLFGDSITSHSIEQADGFSLHAALQEEYIRRLDVINRGFGGYNTDQAVRVLPYIIPARPSQTNPRIALMTIFFGTNDADVTPEQGIPIKRYENNLRQIIEYPALKEHGTKFILITPAALDERMSDGEDDATAEQSVSADNMRQFAAKVQELGEHYDIPVVDLWTAFMKHAEWDGKTPLPGSRQAAKNQKLRELVSDGFHYTAHGYKIMHKELMRVLRTSYPEFHSDKMQKLFPEWSDKTAWANFRPRMSTKS